jgi:hypothetical protein
MQQRFQFSTTAGLLAPLFFGMRYSTAEVLKGLGRTRAASRQKESRGFGS